MYQTEKTCMYWCRIWCFSVFRFALLGLCHFCFASLFLCDSRSREEQGSGHCHPSSITAERWGLVGWHHIAPGPGTGLVGHSLLLLPLPAQLTGHSILV